MSPQLGNKVDFSAGYRLKINYCIALHFIVLYCIVLYHSFDNIKKDGRVFFCAIVVALVVGGLVGLMIVLLAVINLNVISKTVTAEQMFNVK